MPRQSRAQSVTFAAIAALVAPLVGCFAYSHYDGDIDRTPVVDSGVGATIIQPGQSAPAMPSRIYGTPPGVAPASDPTSSSGTPGSAAGGGVTMIGGNQTDQKQHTKIRQEPIWLKYLALPFALVAAPFKAGADAVRGDETPGPAVPESQATPPATQSAPAPTDYETAKLQDIERELDQRQAQERAAGGGPTGSTTTQRRPASEPALLIADELAALQRTPRSLPREGSAPPPVPTAPPSERREIRERSPSEADGIVDRNGDGRIDLWIYRHEGEIVRKALDENYDGRPDRIVHYDLATHQLSRIEEDTNHDGTSDSWTEYRDGGVSRRRADADNDGLADTWTFYRNGEISRHEQDTSGDGFRDRIGIYTNGHLVRQEQDHQGDGLVDVTTHYDANEQITRRDEDSDGDGRIDVIFHYESGRLTRRELMDHSALAPQPALER